MLVKWCSITLAFAAVIGSVEVRAQPEPKPLPPPPVKAAGDEVTAALEAKNAANKAAATAKKEAENALAKAKEAATNAKAAAGTPGEKEAVAKLKMATDEAETAVAKAREATDEAKAAEERYTNARVTKLEGGLKTLEDGQAEILKLLKDPKSKSTPAKASTALSVTTDLSGTTKLSAKDVEKILYDAAYNGTLLYQAGQHAFAAFIYQSALFRVLGSLENVEEDKSALEQLRFRVLQALWSPAPNATTKAVFLRTAINDIRNVPWRKEGKNSKSLSHRMGGDIVVWYILHEAMSGSTAAGRAGTSADGSYTSGSSGYVAGSASRDHCDNRAVPFGSFFPGTFGFGLPGFGADYSYALGNSGYLIGVAGDNRAVPANPFGAFSPGGFGLAHPGFMNPLLFQSSGFPFGQFGSGLPGVGSFGSGLQGFNLFGYGLAMSPRLHGALWSYCVPEPEANEFIAGLLGHTVTEEKKDEKEEKKDKKKKDKKKPE